MVTIKKEVDTCQESYSGILLKERTRKISTEELAQKVTKRRNFVSLEQLDSPE